MISLRVDGMTAKLERSMKEAPGASFETHCGACGMGLATFYEWMSKGEEHPESVYGKFRQVMIQATAEGEKKLHNMAAKSTPIHVLTRRSPSHYPSDKVRMDLTSGDMPISADSTFNVVLELYAPDGVPPEKSFEVEHSGGVHDGERWKWDGDR